MPATGEFSFLRMAVVLDDPETVVSTDGLFAVVTSDGDVALGPASELGDVAEWVFDAESDSFEAAFDLLHVAVLHHAGIGNEPAPIPPERVRVFVWSHDGPQPEELAAWAAARYPVCGAPPPQSEGFLGRCACGEPATREALIYDRVYCAACYWVDGS